MKRIPHREVEKLKKYLSYHTKPPRDWSMKGVSVEDQITKHREELKNKDLEQDIQLKKTTLRILFLFLAVETLLVFIFTFFQATQQWNFRLEEWSFKLLISATLLQITYMLRMAIRYLFPTKKNES